MAGIIGDIKAAAKKNVVKGISKSLFGKGIVGGALGKAFEKKFGDQEEKDTQVADALSEQGNLQDSNNATLARLESVVMNIADNIYNIAGVMNAQVVSMKEAQRLQSERAFKDAAAKEEADAEAKKVDGPGAAGTDTNTAGSSGGSKSILGSVLGSLGNTKVMFKGFLKKFAIVAGALAIGAGAAYAVSSSGEGEAAVAPTPETAAAEQVPPPQQDVSSPEATKVEPPPAESPSSMMTNAISTQGGERGKKEAPLVGNIMSAMQSGDMGGMMGAIQEHQKAFPQPPSPPPAATPAAPPPSPAATPPSSAGGSSEEDVKKISGWLDNPANAADRQQLSDLTDAGMKIKYGLSQARQSLADARPESKKKYEEIVKRYEDDLENIRAQRKAILDKAKKELGISPTSAASSSAPQVPGASESSSSAGPAPTPIASSSSSGADIGSKSVDIAAMSEPKTEAGQTSVNNSSDQAGAPSPNSIPSPIANRGSLDADTVYSST